MKVFLVGSPWHAILATAICCEDSLFVIEKTSETSATSIREILKGRNIFATFDWDDFNFRKRYKNIFTSPLYFNSKIRHLENLSKTVVAEYLYVFNFDSVISRAFIYNSVYSKLVKVEDGICDYLTFRFYTESNELKKALRYVYTNLFLIGKYYNDFERQRIDHGLFFFPEKAPGSFNKCSLSKYYVRLISSIKCNGYDVSPAGGALALIIGQSLFEDGNCTLDSEIELYKKTAKDLVTYRGVNTVIFKPHPRSSSDKLDKLREMNDLVSICQSSAIVETLIASTRFSIVVGVWSNPIFHSQVLFGIKSYSLLPYLIESSKEFKISKKLIRIHASLSKVFFDYYNPYVFGDLDE